MATDIFNKTARNQAGGFSVDKAQLSFSSIGADGTSGLLIQNVQIQYTQQISFVYDLAKADDVYYVAGRTQGTLAIGKIVGSKTTFKTFYSTYGDVCAKKGNIQLSGATGCTGAALGQTGNIIIQEPIITQLGIQMTVDTAIISENVQLMFATLTMS
jgi:hypothetical protein